MTHYIDTITVRVAGIPALAGVTSYTPLTQANTSAGHPDNWYPAEGGEVEFDILDRRGRPAPWLERKIDGQARDRLADEVFRELSRPADWY